MVLAQKTYVFSKSSVKAFKNNINGIIVLVFYIMSQFSYPRTLLKKFGF